MKNIATIVFLIVSLSLTKHAHGQGVNLDSLWTVWNDSVQPDTNRLSAMHDIAWSAYLFTRPDSAFYFATLEYDFAKTRGLKKQMASALNTQGVSYYIRSNYPEAHEYFTRSLKIKEEIGDRKGMASSLNNIGNIFSSQGDLANAMGSYKQALALSQEVSDKKSIAACLGNLGAIYANQGDYVNAIDYQIRGLNIKEEIGDKKGMASSLNNIGAIYKEQSDFDGAIDYYIQSITLKEEIGDKRGIAASLNNIGNIYSDQKDYLNATDYYNRTLSIAAEIGDKKGVSISFSNLGSIYNAQGDYAKALDYFTRSLTIKEEIGDKKGIAISLNNIGLFYKHQGDSAYNAGNTALSIVKYAHAIDLSTRALALGLEVGAVVEIKDAASALYEAYKATGKHKQALKMHELHIATRDSIDSEENQKEVIRQKFKYDYEKKEAVSNAAHQAELERQEAVAAEEQEKQNIIIGSVSGGLGLVILFSSFLFNRFQVTRKQKAVIEEQKEEVDRAYGSLEEKNKEITDSINYAQRIQAAILPPDRLVKKYLADSFVLYKPKDIVAGDFYWMEPVGEQIIFAVADCTGHGVPGAMLSMLCNNALNRSVREYGLTDPGKILDKTREIVIAEFEKSDEHVKDGMDISLCSLNGNKLHFAGAYNLLWMIRNSEVIELKGDRQPIGNSDDPKPFTTHTFDLEEGDLFYIFSDGYVDQFGGKRGKKLKAKAFREILLSVVDKPMQEQKVLMDETFEKWRGDLEQIDDVCIIGVKV